MSKKRFLVSTIIIVAVAIAVAASSQTMQQRMIRIAVVNTQEVFDKYLKTQEAQVKLNEEISKLEEQGKKMSEDLRTLQEKYDKQRIFIDDKKKEQEMLQQIERKKEEIRQFIQAGQQQLDKKRRELTEPIIKEIDQVVQQIGKEEGFDLIVDKIATLYVNPQFDITEKVIQILNQKYLKEHPEAAKSKGGAEKSKSKEQGK
ncbi:TPA: OmpH family outer membrane protein [Candidatus Poribacteria bacterium]|nr:OmpH family outer membrane protein [Candidatus Poribacteria bacterium]HEX28632.1 OmpH family outer membrane protein [Candidatus Poribacteria bacterium]